MASNDLQSVDGAIHAAAGRDLVKECRIDYIRGGNSFLTLRARPYARWRGDWRVEDYEGLQVACVRLLFDALRLLLTPLNRKHVIHTVGPIYHSGDEEKNERLLRSCYRSSLQLAVQHDLKHIVSYVVAVSHAIEGSDGLPMLRHSARSRLAFIDILS